MWLRRRTSSESIPASAEKSSTIRSMAAAASGRPAPRKALKGTVLVSSVWAEKATRSMAYVPVAIMPVRPGSSGAYPEG
jgi:hypothetical protein